MEVSEWNAMEGGWVPSDHNLLKAIAATLEACYLHVSFVASVSQYNQELLSA